MNKPLKLSHTSIDRYLTCPKKYKLHDLDRIRPEKLKSALIFGGCLDSGLNLLFEGKSLEDAKVAFTTEWLKFRYNKDIIYAKSDLNLELLSHYGRQLIEDPEWNSLCFKGYLMLEAAEQKILPTVQKTLSVQKKVQLKNNAGDEINGLLDAIIVLKNGKTALIDNKSSSVKYEPDSPKNSQQLVLYHYIEKDTIKIDEVGFFVYSKKINLNKSKICKKCDVKNEGSHKTCPEGKNRCGGEFLVTYNPECEVEQIFNKVEESDEERVLNDIDFATENIKAGNFEPNFKACHGKFGKCDYFELCHSGSMQGLKVLEKRK